MLGDLRLAVVVPARDEAAHIGRVLATMPAAVDHVVVVDDGSRDGTGDIARGHADPRVDVVRHDVAAGVGAAIVSGYRHAFGQGADAAVVMAGDGQMDPTDLPTLLAPIVAGEADYVCGDRMSHGGVRASMPLPRRLGNRVLTALTRWSTGVDVRDAQCGYTALRGSCADRLDLDAVWPGYGYPNDLLARAALGGLRIRRVVVRPIYADEESGVRVWHAVLVIPFVIGRAWWRGRRRRAASAARARVAGHGA